MGAVNSGNSIVNAMLSGISWGTGPGAPANVTYSFMTYAPATGEAVDFDPLSSADETTVEQALQTFSAVANITFTQELNGGFAGIMFGLDTQTYSDGLTYEYSGGASTGGLKPYLNAHTYFANNGGDDLTWSWLVLHELGNATGLFDFSGLTYAQDEAQGLAQAQANFDYTVMANNYPAHGTVPQGYFTSTPALYDIEALQYLYGANQNGFTAGAASSSSGLTYKFGDDTMPLSIWVGSKVAGQTTLDFSACTGATIIDLNAGSFSSTAITPAGYYIAADSGTPFDNVSIAFGTTIRKAIAGNGGATITGNNANDTLTGGTGNDSFYVDGGTGTAGTGGNTTINGGGGDDTVVFHDPQADYTIVTASNGTATVTETNGGKGDGTTTATGITNFQFADGKVSANNPDGAVADRLGGSLSQYSYAQTAPGTLSLQDNDFSGDRANGGTVTLTEGQTVQFADGAGLADPNGSIADLARLYQAAFDREPDLGGLQYWAGSEAQGNSLQAIADGFTGTAEYKTDFASSTNTQFVAKVYENVLGRAPDAGGAAFWLNVLGQGFSQGYVVMQFAESAEDKADTLAMSGSTDDADITRLYQAAFNRVPDAGGSAFWVNSYGKGTSLLTIAQQMGTTSEYQADFGGLSAQDFVTELYRNVLGRAPDAGGLTYWSSALTSGGQTQAQVLVGFANSTENRLATSAITHDGMVLLHA